jgi:hypothetical protein
VVVQHRDRRDAEMENEVMATKQTSKQAKTKTAAELGTKIINKPVRNSEPKPERRIRRARSRSAAADIYQAGAVAGAPDGTVVHDKAEQTLSHSKPTLGRADVAAASVSSADQPPASTKRAKLIAMLERPEGASVAEIGQRFGWLPHTVRAAITGLRKASHEVTRSRNTDDRSVYRLAPVEPASQR